MHPTIAIVLNASWNIYNFRMGLIEKLQERGYRVIALAPPDEYSPKLIAAGVEFFPLHFLVRKSTNPFKDLRLIRELRKMYVREGVDLALQYTIKPNIYGTLAATFTRTKTICTITGLGYAFLSKGLASVVAKWLYKFAFRRADRIFFQNADDFKLFQRLKLADPARSKVVRGSGINTHYFNPAYNHTAEQDTIHFLFIGRLLHDKGVKEMMAAATEILHRNTHARFSIIGDIDDNNPAALERTALQQWLAANPSVEHITHTNDVRSYLAKADVVVLPSYREGLPRVMLEGLSMAKPLITTDVPGCRETVTDGHNGFLVKVKDVDSLVNAMQRMIHLTPSQRTEMGQRGRKLALQHFDEKSIVQHYLEEAQQLAPLPFSKQKKVEALRNI